MQFSFEHGLTPDTPRTRRTWASKPSAPCQCYELGLTCFHTVKERTTSVGDSVTYDAKSLDRPAWRKYHAIERMQNTRRYNASKV